MNEPENNQFSLGFMIAITSVVAGYLGILNWMHPPDRVNQSLVLFALFWMILFFATNSTLEQRESKPVKLDLRKRILVGTIGAAMASIAIELFQQLIGR
jgi:membrane protein implicated in regulation of membrane protease activity